MRRPIRPLARSTGFGCSTCRGFWPAPGRASFWATSEPTVIKVERPGAGDDTRGWGPPFAADAEGNENRRERLFPLRQPQQALGGDRHRPAGRRRPGPRPRGAERHPAGELQGRRPEEIRPGLGPPAPGEPRAGLLLDHRFRPDRPLCRSRGLRLHDPGGGRADERHRRARRPAGAADRRRSAWRWPTS